MPDGGTKNLEQMLEEVSAELVKINSSVKQHAETSLAEVKAIGKLSEEAKAETDKLLVKQAEVNARLTEVEQKMARQRDGGVEKPKSLGQMFAENPDVKKFCETHQGSTKGSFKMPVKAELSSTGSAGGVLVQPDRLPGIIAPPQRRLTIRDLLMPGRTSSNLIEYVKESGFDNQARSVTEGAQKPESNITFEDANAPVRTIAHWVLATRQILADAPQLQSYVDGRLMYGLKFVEELQLLKGDGTGVNLDGIVPQATSFSPAFTPANGTRIDELRLAILQAELAEYPTNGIVLHPTDWAAIELTKDSIGLYVFANPLQMAGPVLWGKPVVPTQAMDEGEFLTGAFSMGAQVFDREDASIEISTQDRDNFVKNKVTLLCEERLALAVYRGESFITGEFQYTTN
ncbi:phage major capsid protein [Dongia sp.]|uniref:phage major capsid protein n=1 Tax=Dongia sp. TaxID=1977262 RepID=UPI0035B3864D